jgi:DNA modification methylase
MDLFYSEPCGNIYCGDSRQLPLPDESVQCVVTSPPYWGLRKYSGDQDLVWGDNHCEHQWGEILVKQGAHKAGETNPGLEGYTKDRNQWSNSQGRFCSLCGGWRGALGLEPTPEMYVSHIVEIFQEVKRVLRKDGVAFVNIGDTYAGSPSGHPSWDGWQTGGIKDASRNYEKRSTVVSNLKPKDLCLIPFHLAIALHEHGWWIRSVICWSKPNPMPESVNGWRWERHKIRVKVGKANTGETSADRPLDAPNHPYRGDGWEVQALEGRLASEYVDCPGCPKCLPNGGYVLRKGSWRPTESHEYILMLSKRDNYYCDAESVREPLSELTLADRRNASGRHIYSDSNWQDADKSSWYRANTFVNPQAGRNLRSVWTFPTTPYPGVHFATFPEKLPELCIKAATPEVGCCSKCGAPSVRVLDKKASQFSVRVRDAKAGRGTAEEGYKATEEEIAKYPDHPDPGYRQTLGWRPSCSCNAQKVPSVVLDPFCGAGTTAKVAKQLGRRFVGIDISEEYCRLSQKRLESVPLSMVV